MLIPLNFSFRQVPLSGACVEECGDGSEAGPRGDTVDDPTKHKLKFCWERIWGRFKQQRVAGPVEAGFESTFIRLVSFFLVPLYHGIPFALDPKTIVIYSFCWDIHPTDLNGPNKCKDLSSEASFFQIFIWRGTSSRLLFRLRCFASPRKRLFCPFLLGLRCHHTDGWQASQSSRYHSKCHNWTRCTVFFQQILCGQRSESRTMLTEQFSLKCDHQRLFLWRQFLGLVTPEYICISPSMESTN